MNAHAVINETSPAAAPGSDSDQIPLDLMPVSMPAPVGEMIEPDNSGEFDWLRDESIVVQPQPGIAIYRNRGDHIVIRCQAEDFDGEDKFVYIGTETATKAVIGALNRELKAGGLR